MQVRAKFKVASITDFGTNKQAKLNAIYGTEGENADFTKYTPYGELTIGIDAASPAAEVFAVGKEFYLTFEAAN